MKRLIGIGTTKPSQMKRGIECVHGAGLTAFFSREGGSKLSHHNEVISLCGTKAPLLPAQFLDGREVSVLEDVLVTHHKTLTNALHDANGKVEIAFSAKLKKWDQPNQKLEKLKGVAFLKKRADELRRASVNEEVSDRLKARFIDAPFPAPRLKIRSDQHLITGSVLTERAHGPQIAAFIEATLTAEDAVTAVDLLGPLPPYSFLSVSSIIGGAS